MKTIYGIFDSLTNECKYVGQTKNLKNRIYRHKYLSAYDEKPIYKWMKNNEYYFKEFCIVEDCFGYEVEEAISNTFSTLLNIRIGKQMHSSLKTKLHLSNSIEKNTFIPTFNFFV